MQDPPLKHNIRKKPPKRIERPLSIPSNSSRYMTLMASSSRRAVCKMSECGNSAKELAARASLSIGNWSIDETVRERQGF